MKQLSEQREKELRYISFLSKNVGTKFSREQNYLIILSRDLAKGFRAINALGIEKSKENQFYFDFILSFEELKEKMAEFRWSSEFLMQNGIDFKSLRKLYFSLG